jgi:phospholipid-binding lipoprotein MlaA
VPVLGALRSILFNGITGSVPAITFAIIAVASITGCAGSGSDASQNDPAEPVNRAIFDANHAVDRNVLRPVAEAYQDWVPKWARTGVHNFSANLKQPATVANDLLQGNASYAWTATKRFAINTTVGGAGVVDVAAERGLAPHTSDFGQTLAVWGVDEGPFIELPVLGPSNLRDAFGTLVGFALDPLTAIGSPIASALSYAGSGAGMVDARSNHLQDLDALERSSLDYYATLRSAYRQAREAKITAAKQGEPKESRGYIDIRIEEPR